MSTPSEKKDEKAGESSGKLITIDTKKLATEMCNLAVATDIRPQKLSGRAGDDVDRWVCRFEVVTKALE